MPVFLAPWFLMVAATALVPLALHLLWKRRPQPMPFSSLRFLQKAMVSTRRARRITQFLLLLLRVLILLCLALAFARPKVSLGAGSGGGNRTILIVLDASASMQFRQGGGSSFDLTRELAGHVIAGLGETDKAAILAPGLTEPRIVFPPTSDKARLRSALGGLQPGFSRCDLSGFLQELLRQPPAGLALRGLELHLCGDFQSSGWPPAAAPALAGKLKSGDVTLFLNQIRPERLANAGIRKASLQPPAVLGPDPVQTEVTLAFSVDRDHGGAVEFKINGITADSQPFTPAPGDPTRLILRGAAPAGTDPVPCRIELPQDAFPLDNFYHLILERDAGLPVWIVRNTPADGWFLEAALRPGGAGPQSLTFAEFAGREAPPGALVLLCNPPAGNRDLLQKLEALLASGGTVVLFAGDGGGLAAALDGAWPPAQGVQAVPRQSAEAERCLLLPRDRAPDLEKRLRAVLPGPPAFTMTRRLALSRLPETATAVLEYPDRSPFLAGLPVGPGRLWLCSIPADRSWSDFPLTPGFVVLYQELLREAAARARPPLTTEVGGTVALPWPENVTEASFDLIAPGNQTTRLLPRRKSASDPFAISGFTEPGIWRLTRGAGTAAARLIAVNLPPEEMDLTYLDVRKLAGELAPAQVLTARTLDELESNLRLARFGRPFWPQLLAAAMFLALIELFLANWLIRSPAAAKA